MDSVFNLFSRWSMSQSKSNDIGNKLSESFLRSFSRDKIHPHVKKAHQEFLSDALTHAKAAFTEQPKLNRSTLDFLKDVHGQAYQEGDHPRNLNHDALGGAAAFSAYLKHRKEKHIKDRSEDMHGKMIEFAMGCAFDLYQKFGKRDSKSKKQEVMNSAVKYTIFLIWKDHHNPSIMDRIRECVSRLWKRKRT